MAHIPMGRLLDLMMSDESGPSQVFEEERGARKKVTREWSKESLRFFLTVCRERYWKYDRKPFREKNYVEFALQLHAEFLKEPQRSWQQCRDK